MRNSLKPVILLVGVALVGSAAAPAFAQNKSPEDDDTRRPRQENRMDRADSDGDGALSFEEFAAAGPDFFSEADSDGDGTITANELVDRMLRQRLMDRAERMIARFDVDGDGQLTTDEIEERQQKMFALMDVDNSGSIEEDEMRRRHFGIGRDGHDDRRGFRDGRGGRHMDGERGRHRFGGWDDRDHHRYGEHRRWGDRWNG